MEEAVYTNNNNDKATAWSRCDNRAGKTMTVTKQITKKLKSMGKGKYDFFFWKETKTTTKWNGTATKVHKQKEMNANNEVLQARM